ATFNLSKSLSTIDVTQDLVIGAVFHGFGSGLDISDLSATSSKIIFKAPTATSGQSGTVVQLPGTISKKATDAMTKGVKYSIQGLNAMNKLVNYTAGSDVAVIAYQLPKQGNAPAPAPPNTKIYKVLDTNGNHIIYHSTLKAFDLDQDHAPEQDC